VAIRCDNVGRARKAVKIAAPEGRHTMPTLPWRFFDHAEPERHYVALLSYLPLRSGRHVPGFLLHTLRIRAQLRRSRGLLGYSLRAELAAKRFWTLSAWQDEASLQDFVHARHHARTMTALTPHMGATRFIRWTAKGSELPPSWEDALRRWREG
jgi:quinol monooxygenase YgiN